jgi:hypothetical protein
MIVLMNIVICLFNSLMAFDNYEKKNYKSAMLSTFLSGFAIAIAIIAFFDEQIK